MLFALKLVVFDDNNKGGGMMASSETGKQTAFRRWFNNTRYRYDESTKKNSIPSEGLSNSIDGMSKSPQRSMAHTSGIVVEEDRRDQLCT